LSGVHRLAHRGSVAVEEVNGAAGSGGRPTSLAWTTRRLAALNDGAQVVSVSSAKLVGATTATLLGATI